MDPLGAIGDLAGAGLNFIGNQMQGDENRQAQEDFAKHGLGWRVADAKAAGINPLAALGAQLNSFQSTVGAGTGVAAAGQDISRAMHALGSPEDRQAAALKTKLDLERSGIQNDILRFELAGSARRAAAAGTPPGIPKAFKEFEGRSGEHIWLPSKEAAGGYQALGGIVGAGEAVLGQRGGGGGPGVRGVSPEPSWNFTDFRRWLFPPGSTALFGGN